MTRSPTYAPWRRANYGKALVFSVLGIVGLYGGYRGLIDWRMATGIGLVLLGLGYAQFRRGRTRQFGKGFERRSLAAAGDVLRSSGLRFETGRLVRGIGDVDLIVTNGQRRRITVEIKSFVHWRQFGPLKGRRESKALRQAASQRLAIGADRAVVWLPQGRPSMLQVIFGWVGNQDVTVIFGEARKLARWISLLR